MKGKVVKVVDDKGFGFIKPDGEEGDLFFHATGMAGGRSEFDDLKEGEAVEFDKEQHRGRDRAVQVRKA